jgi:ATP-dependent DNA helicase RecG
MPYSIVYAVSMRHELLFFLFSQITRIKGVGGATAKALERLLPAATNSGGLPTVRDILFHLPVGLVDRRFTCPLSEAPDGVVATFVVEVDEHIPPKQKRYGKQPYKILCSNETGTLTLVFFHARDDYFKQALPVGKKRVISGKVEHFDFQLQMTHPDVIAPLDKLADVQKPEAVYPLTVGLTSRRIHNIVTDALSKMPELPEWIANSKWLSWKAALTQAHNPETQEDLLPTSPARARLAYDEMFANQLHLAILRRQTKRQNGEVVKGTGKLTEPLKSSLPYTLTQGQEAVLAEIYKDMESGHRMTRLLQGDVGSGKTIVALFAMLRAVEQGAQAALMVPTELVAQQHYENIVASWRLLVAGNANNQKLTTSNQIILLTGSVKGKARKDALEAIKSGEAGIVIGTHALFQEHVEFDNLALVVIDEQHRFGVGQRMALSNKGNSPHLLHLTATPIPRSLSMTLYGDMDASKLTEKPAGRQPITTRLIPLSRYNDIMERLKAALDRGEKAYWICPLIEENRESGIENQVNLDTRFSILDSDLAAAKSRYTEFTARFGDMVGIVHGRMKTDERNAEMQKFTEGKTRLLVATTVVEVGVDVKDATIIVIERAERFGLAQLHQLRGRVGRGDKPSACVLLYSEVNGEQWTVNGDNSVHHPPSTVHRLSILRETEDGFKIAEADLALRGAGELLGVRQSGLPKTIFMDLFYHQELLEQARKDAFALLEQDPELKSPRGEAAKLLLQLFMKEYSTTADPVSQSAEATG